MSYCGQICRDKYGLFEWGQKKACKKECAESLDLQNAPVTDPTAEKDTAKMYSLMQYGLIILAVISFGIFIWMIIKRKRRKK